MLNYNLKVQKILMNLVLLLNFKQKILKNYRYIMNLVNFIFRDFFFKLKYGKDIYMYELFKYFFFFLEN